MWTVWSLRRSRSRFGSSGFFTEGVRKFETLWVWPGEGKEREWRGKTEWCVCCEFKTGWVFSVSHSQYTPGPCVKAPSGNVFPTFFTLCEVVPYSARCETPLRVIFSFSVGSNKVNLRRSLDFQWRFGELCGYDWAQKKGKVLKRRTIPNSGFTCSWRITSVLHQRT